MTARRLYLFLVLLTVFLLSGCGGGGGSDASPPEEPVEAPPTSTAPGSSNTSGGTTGSVATPNGAIAVAPGEYASLSKCTPFAGSEVAEFKILFANLDNAPYFDEIVNDAVENQFRALPPFSEHFSRFAFYRIDLKDFATMGCRTQTGSAFSCDDKKVIQAMNQQCGADDIYGIIKVVVADAGYGASGGEVIYLGSDRRWPDTTTALQHLRNIVVHEVAHNFGLADLYETGIDSSGTTVEGWPSELSRQWRNLDGPGCSKWCGSYKPASEYTLTTSATCPTLTTRDSCTSFNRTEAGECTKDENGNYQCCTWSDNAKDDYFASQCTPAWGSEDIGMDCLEGAGCYYGGAYGNNSWRPVNTWSDSIMYGAGHSQAFDSVSTRELDEAIRCCGSSDDGTASCTAYRAEYAEFLAKHQPYKQRVGSCGVR
ncbi:hypothetical protein [Microbulbifer pacificus]|uniref:hypothetical protein n=1 Tax=Microbulbifer pacificus TaxID=407164 RepID=UPI00131A01A2|nr:hypothetical protein [Microbulbifer pacificus]